MANYRGRAVNPDLTPSEVFEDPQIAHNGGVRECEHPVYGSYRKLRHLRG